LILIFFHLKASGSGKTTLLNALNFRNRGNLIIDGNLKINGQVVKSQKSLAAISGYVQQDDLVNLLFYRYLF
jgi:ABC-type multidrug transport system ATPase subunit